MQHYHIHESVDRTFQDICLSDKPFGGLSVVFGGDFKQILPVIVNFSRAQIVGACINGLSSGSLSKFSSSQRTCG